MKNKLENYKVFIDPFENLKNIQTLSSSYKIILKIDNNKLPVSLDMLDISSDYNAEKDDKCNIDPHNLFNFDLNEEDNSILIQPKSNLDTVFNHITDKTKLHLILKSTNTKHLLIRLLNCKLKIHNSTHFKHEVINYGDQETNVKPHFLNPYFKQLSFDFDNSEVTMEKFDHKFVNSEYSYNFRIVNGTNLTIRKFFIYDMNCEIDSSYLHIDKIMGYKLSTDPTHTKNLLKIQTVKSQIDIKNFLNCGHFELKSLCEGEIESHEENNNLNINNFSSNSFDIQMADNDLIHLNVSDLSDNSHLKYNFGNGKIRIHPFLLIALNIYEVLNKRFLSMLMMGRDGYVFCPTVIVDTNQELKKREITAWEMIKFKNTWAYKFVALLFTYFMYKVLTAEEKVNYELSQFKQYQLFFKKVVHDYLNKLN